MRKALFTLTVDNYQPEITALTFPHMEEYAQKIDAEFILIRDRKFSAWPAVYEKLQIFELGRDFDWSIYFDADTLIHPDFFDVTNHIPKDTVLHWGADMAGNRWRYDKYFQRDGRHIGSGNWFSVASDWCLDLWHPLHDLSLEEAVQNIFPAVFERNNGITREHLIDDYVLSRNIAKYGLKFKSLRELQKEMNREPEVYFFHNYLLQPEQKIAQMKETLKRWDLGISKPVPEIELVAV